MSEEKHSSPVIETIINTTALSLTAWGVLEIQKTNYYGFVVVVFGMGLEYFKYLGRKKLLWGKV